MPKRRKDSDVEKALLEASIGRFEQTWIIVTKPKPKEEVVFVLYQRGLEDSITERIDALGPRFVQGIIGWRYSKDVIQFHGHAFDFHPEERKRDIQKGLDSIIKGIIEKDLIPHLKSVFRRMASGTSEG